MPTINARSWRTVVLVASVLLLGGVSIWLSAPSTPKELAETASRAERIAFYEQEIRTLGAKGSYAALAKRMDGRTITRSHAEAHVFGSALFAVEGNHGLAVCDARFQFGCFHEFLAHAIDTNGLASVGELNQACKAALGNNFLSCQHGIGHGVLTSVGYREEDLITALGVCKDLPGSDIVGGCYGGVFMEYNMRTMWGEDATPREDTDRNRPCTVLDPVFRQACVYWQPQWWYESDVKKGTEGDTSYAEMGKLCDSYTGDVRHSCFGGIGNQAPISRDFTLEKGVRWCDAAAITADDFAVCTQTLANSVGVSYTQEDGLAVCALAARKGFDSEQCERFARNQLNTMNVQGFETNQQ